MPLGVIESSQGDFVARQIIEGTRQPPAVAGGPEQPAGLQVVPAGCLVLLGVTEHRASRPERATEKVGRSGGAAQRDRLLGEAGRFRNGLR